MSWLNTINYISFILDDTLVDETLLSQIIYDEWWLVMWNKFFLQREKISDTLTNICACPVYFYKVIEEVISKELLVLKSRVCFINPQVFSCESSEGQAF